jgi:hypothetical protein
MSPTGSGHECRHNADDEHNHTVRSRTDLVVLQDASDTPLPEASATEDQ